MNTKLNKKCSVCGTQIDDTNKSMLCKKHKAEQYMKQYNKNYYANHSDDIRKHVEQWRQDNREIVLEKSKLRRENRDFDGKREKILQRDNYTCQICNKFYGKENSNKLIVHHKDEQGRGKSIKNNNENNLITLCRSCHLSQHRESMREKYVEKCIDGKWAIKYDRCISCGTTSIKHEAKGLCVNYYAKMLRKKKKI